MRVVFVTHNYPRRPGDLSGAFLASLARGLVSIGVDVRVIAPSDGGDVGEPTLDGVPVRRVRYAEPELETLAYRGTMNAAIRRPRQWRLVTALWRALRSATEEEIAAGADLVHAHWWVPAGLAMPKGAIYVLTVHGTDAALLRHSRAARLIARPVFRRSRLVTAVSRELAAWVQASTGRYVGHEHVHPMPVDSRSYEWGTGGGGAIVIARLTAQKRVRLAIEAIAFLESCGATMPLTVIGDGPERPELERLAASLGVSEHVRFVGAVTPEAIPRYLASADVMLFPAQHEGYGLAAAEALMAGVPVVACWDGGGVLDVVPDGGAGRLTLPQPEAIADGVLDILADPERAARGRAAGEELRSKLAPEHVAAVCERWYREALRA